MDVTSIGRSNPKKRLVHNHIKAGSKSKIIIIKWKGRSHLRPNSRAQMNSEEKHTRLFIEDQHNTSNSWKVTDGDSVEWFVLDEAEFGLEWISCRSILRRVTGFLHWKWLIFSTTKWMLQRQRNIQPVRMNQRLTDGKTQQEPMEMISLDGWANLYAPQTVFTS